MPEPRYASESWRWVQGDDKDPAEAWLLVAGPGPLPGPRVILRCGNIDAEDMDGIGALPAMYRALNEVRSWIEEDTMVDLDDLSDDAKGILETVRTALAAARGEGVSDG